jgi:nitrite reductase/ring-hydroxylating ferredoxin subunit
VRAVFDDIKRSRNVEDVNNAYDNEIGRKPPGRTVLGEPVVLFRKQDGTPVALEDRCVHRHLPLSMGRLVGDTLQCHYHGLRYDGAGACVMVPGQDTIPPGARVKTYPVVERYRWLWIWMGDPARADPAGIADFHWLDDPAWGATVGLQPANGDLEPVLGFIQIGNVEPSPSSCSPDFRSLSVSSWCVTNRNRRCPPTPTASGSPRWT